MKKKRFEFDNILTISLAHLVHDTYASFLAPILPLLFWKLPALANTFIRLIADKIGLILTYKISAFIALFPIPFVIKV